MPRRTPPERVVVSLCVYENGASKVRNLLSLIERTPPTRVVKGLCDRDTYFCSPRFYAILNRSPCSPWEQHHVVSAVAQAPT
jgi:hypothetical protein